jgi:ribosomal protein L29
MIKFSELKQKPREELERMIKELQEKMRQYRFDKASGKAKSYKEAIEARKEVARILTVFNLPKLKSKE